MAEEILDLTTCCSSVLGCTDSQKQQCAKYGPEYTSSGASTTSCDSNYSPAAGFNKALKCTRTSYLGNQDYCCRSGAPEAANLHCNPAYINDRFNSAVCLPNWTNWCNDENIKNDGTCQQWLQQSTSSTARSKALTHCNNPSNINNSTCASLKTHKPELYNEIMTAYCSDRTDDPAGVCKTWCNGNPGVCDTYMNSYCNNSANKNDPACSCLNSPVFQLAASTNGVNPVCLDANCVQKNGYLNTIMKDTSCDYINCTLYNTAGDIEKSAVAWTNNITQNCGNKAAAGSSAATPAATSSSKTTLSTTLIIIIVVCVFAFLIAMVATIGAIIYYKKENRAE